MKRSTQRWKGSSYEYDAADSLKQVYPDILLTKQQGFVQEFDLVSHAGKAAFECKRHKGFSWNELEKYFTKLESRAPEGYTSWLIFQANRQPPLVMSRCNGIISVVRFEEEYGVPFIKHAPVRRNENVDKIKICDLVSKDNTTE